MECRISDATTGTVGNDRFKWVKCELIEGDIKELSKPESNKGVLVKHLRVYLIGGKLVEKETTAWILYKKQIRGV